MASGPETEHAYSQMKWQREEISTEKVKKKRISGEAYDTNKQTIYMAPKSETESRAHYALEPTRGNKTVLVKFHQDAQHISHRRNDKQYAD